jgi:hypothetical protein
MSEKFTVPAGTKNPPPHCGVLTSAKVMLLLLD